MQEDHTKCFSLRIAKNNTRIRHSILNKDYTNLILYKDILLVICTDSKSLYDCLVKLGITQEKRLIIDVISMRKAYERREIAQVK